MAERRRKHQVTFGLRGSDAHYGSSNFFCFFETPEVHHDRSEIELRKQVAWIERDARAIFRFSFAKTQRRVQHVAEIVVRIDKTRIELERFAISRDCLISFLLIAKRVAQVEPGERRTPEVDRQALKQRFGFGEFFLCGERRRQPKMKVELLWLDPNRASKRFFSIAVAFQRHVALSEIG